MVQNIYVKWIQVERWPRPTITDFKHNVQLPDKTSHIRGFEQLISTLRLYSVICELYSKPSFLFYFLLFWNETTGPQKGAICYMICWSEQIPEKYYQDMCRSLSLTALSIVLSLCSFKHFHYKGLHIPEKCKINSTSVREVVVLVQ